MTCPRPECRLAINDPIIQEVLLKHLNIDATHMCLLQAPCIYKYILKTDNPGIFPDSYHEGYCNIKDGVEQTPLTPEELKKIKDQMRIEETKFKIKMMEEAEKKKAEEAKWTQVGLPHD